MSQKALSAIRTASLGLSTGLAVAALCLIFSMYDGLQAELRALLSRLEEESLRVYFIDSQFTASVEKVTNLDREGMRFFRSPYLNSYLPERPQPTQSRLFEQPDLEVIRQLKGVEAVAWEEYLSPFLASSDLALGVRRVAPELLKIKGLQLRLGRMPADAAGTAEVIIGGHAAQELFGATNPVGNVIRTDPKALPPGTIPAAALGGRTDSRANAEPYEFTVVGVLSPPLAGSTPEDKAYDSAILLVTSQPTAPIGVLYVKPYQGFQESAKAAIASQYLLTGGSRLQLKIEPIVEPYQRSLTGNFLTLVRKGLVWITLLALFLSAVCVSIGSSFGTMLRWREIGVRRSLGATRVHLSRHFVGDGLRLGGIACSIGLAATIISRPFLRDLTGVYPRIGLSTLLAAGCVSIVFGVLATSTMVFRAIRIAPMGAVRERTGTHLRRRYTWLSGLCVALSIFVLVLSLALRDGLRARMDEILGWVGDRTIGFVSWNNLSYASTNAAYLTGEDFQAVQRTYPNWNVAWLGDGGSNKVVQTSPNLPEVRKIHLQSGRWFTKQEEAAQANVVVLGSEVAKQWASRQNVEPAMIKTWRGATVVGVLGEWELMVNAGFSPYKVYVPIGSQMREEGTVIGTNEPLPKGQLYISVPKATDLGTAAKQLQDFLKSRHPEGVPQMVLPNAIAEDTLDRRNVIYNVAAFFAVMCLIIGGITLMNISFVTALSRTREFGVRRALGASQVSIVLQIIREAVGPSVWGALAGAGMGLLVARPLQHRFGWPPTIHVELLIVTAAIATGVAILFTALPALWAASLSPSRATKTE